MRLCASFVPLILLAQTTWAGPTRSGSEISCGRPQSTAASFSGIEQFSPELQGILSSIPEIAARPRSGRPPWNKPALGAGRIELPNGGVAYSYCDPEARLEKPDLRVANYNIYMGGTWRADQAREKLIQLAGQPPGMDHTTSAERAELFREMKYSTSIAHVLKNLEALGPLDVLGLQEVEMNSRRTEGNDPADIIAHHFGLCGVYSRADTINAIGERVPFGNAIFSRYPFADRFDYHYRADNRSGVVDNLTFERRSVAGIKIKSHRGSKSQDLYFLSTHLSEGWKHEIEFTDRMTQAQQLKEFTRSWGGRHVMIMGDFNTNPGGREVAELTRMTPRHRRQGYPTFKVVNELTNHGNMNIGSWSGNNAQTSSQLDHIYVAGFGKARGFHHWAPPVKAEQGSDHLPVVLKIDL